MIQAPTPWAWCQRVKCLSCQRTEHAAIEFESDRRAEFSAYSLRIAETFSAFVFPVFRTWLLLLAAGHLVILESLAEAVRGDVFEDLLTAVGWGDKAEALVFAQEFYSAGRHRFLASA